MEVIGWLYQFYISEKKDAVFAALKQGQKIASEDIPAATQLFTPHWIVRFVVENSLGRLWLLNRPTSKLADRMPYYIRPEEPEEGFVRVGTPEELRICDPAVGSGHMLTYAFELLYAIYEEEGYNPPDVPRLILEKNLYGMEIDERAGALAAFALTMKARSRDSRFLRRHVQPNVCVLLPVTFAAGEVEQTPWVQSMGANLLELPLRDAMLRDLEAYEEVATVGALIRPIMQPNQIEEVSSLINGAADLFNQELNERVISVLERLKLLANSYHVVVANPPYMGSGGMNDELKRYLYKHYSDGKSDLFSAFVLRIMDMTSSGGYDGVMTPFTWMFLSTYEKLRSKLIHDNTLLALIRPEYHALFGTAFVPICAFTFFHGSQPALRGAFIDLGTFYGADIQPDMALAAIENPRCGWFYRASSSDLDRLPGSPIAYWVSEQVREIFSSTTPLVHFAAPRQGMATTNNELFLRVVARSWTRSHWLRPRQRRGIEITLQVVPDK